MILFLNSNFLNSYVPSDKKKLLVFFYIWNWIRNSNKIIFFFQIFVIREVISLSLIIFRFSEFNVLGFIPGISKSIIFEVSIFFILFEVF